MLLLRVDGRGSDKAGRGSFICPDGFGKKQGVGNKGFLHGGCKRYGSFRDGTMDPVPLTLTVPSGHVDLQPCLQALDNRPLCSTLLDDPQTSTIFAPSQQYYYQCAILKMMMDLRDPSGSTWSAVP